MPDKVIDIPSVGQIAFPDTMSDNEINAAATRLYQQKNPNAKQPPVKSWVDTAVDWLPTVGGAVGGIVGGIGGTAFGMGVGGVPGAVGGAALGGAAGEAAKQLVNRATGAPAPNSPTAAAEAIGTEAFKQGAAEVAGQGAAMVLRRPAQALIQSALKVGGKGAVRAAMTGKIPVVVNTMLDEGINVTPGGMRKLNLLLDASQEDIKDAIANVSADVNPFKVASKLTSTAKTFANQVNPTADLEAVSKAGQEFLETAPRPLSVQAAQAMKQGTYQQLANKYGEIGSAATESQKALARGLKDEVAAEVDASLAGVKGKLGLPGGVDITAMNAREGAMLEARDALAKRLVVTQRQNPVGLAALAVSHPLTFLTVLADRSAAVKSLLARGLYVPAGAAAKMDPQLIRTAMQLVASGQDSEGQ